MDSSEDKITDAEYSKSLENSKSLVKWAHLKSADVSKNANSDSLSAHFGDRIITGFDQHYFNQGLTLISSLRQQSYHGMIHVYDLGLSPAQKSVLSTLKSVARIEPPENLIKHSWQRQTKNYVYKNMIAHHALQISISFEHPLS